MTLTEVTYECKVCDTEYVIETIGDVVSGPHCPNCHKFMTRRSVVTYEQQELDLFDSARWNL